MIGKLAGDIISKAILGAVIGILLILFLSSAAIAQSDYEIRTCERLDPSDPCYRDLAVSRSDASICRLIESVATRNGCYLKIADNTNNKGLCTDIRKERGSFKDKYDCYKDFITGIEDRDFCLIDLKGDEESQDKCFGKIASKEKDAALCDDLLLEDSQMDCILDTASELQDSSLCQLIRTKIDLNRCKLQGGNGCDTREKIDTALYECEQKIVVGKRRDICRSRTGEKEFNLDYSEEQDLDFRGFNAVHLKYKSASLLTGVGVFDVTIDGRSREMTLQPGMTGEYRFVNVYVIDLVEQGSEESPQEPRMVLCAYADPVPTVTSPPPKKEPVVEPKPVAPKTDDPVVEPIVEDQPDIVDVPASSVHTTSRPSFFQWLGGIAGGVGSFFKKILF